MRPGLRVAHVSRYKLCTHQCSLITTPTSYFVSPLSLYVSSSRWNLQPTSWTTFFLLKLPVFYFEYMACPCCDGCSADNSAVDANSRKAVQPTTRSGAVFEITREGVCRTEERRRKGRGWLSILPISPLLDSLPLSSFTPSSVSHS